VNAATARRILAVDPVVHGAAPTSVDATGTRRRLQALVAIGWPTNELGARLGNKSRYLKPLHADRVSRQTAESVDALYEQLKDTPGPDQRAVRRGARLHWAPPGYWDDIDNPDAVPAGLPTPKPRVPQETRQRRAFLMAEKGTPTHKIAAHFGVTTGTVRRDLAAYEERRRRRGRSTRPTVGPPGPQTPSRR
jgi:hypothetical protein